VQGQILWKILFGLHKTLLEKTLATAFCLLKKFMVKKETLQYFLEYMYIFTFEMCMFERKSFEEIY